MEKWGSGTGNTEYCQLGTNNDTPSSDYMAGTFQYNIVAICYDPWGVPVESPTQ